MAEPEDDDPPGVPEWVVTYGDMMSLLLTFFIMLVSMSQLKEEGRLRAMLDSIRRSFGATPGEAGVPGKSNQTTSKFNKRDSSGRRSESGTKRSGRIEKGLSGGHVTVRRVNHGTVISLGGPLMFERFDSKPRDQLKEDVKALANIILREPHKVVVRGHASPEPLPKSEQFGDQMELSFARAQAVADLLVEQGLGPERISVSAVGASEPRLLSRQDDGQAANRRVDVFIVDTYISADSEKQQNREPPATALRPTAPGPVTVR